MSKIAIGVATAAAILWTVAASAQTMSPGMADQPTAGSTGSLTGQRGIAPTISPSDPAYSENGAPRAGQPSGTDTAGAPSATGNYAPIQHERERFPR